MFVEGISASVAFITYYIDIWVWSPPSAAYFILILLLVESITGTLVAVMVKKEVFNVKKFARTLPILVSHILILAICHNIGKFEPLLSWMTSAAFSWFSTRTALNIFIDLADLKFLKGEFVEFIRGKITKSLNKDEAN